MTPEGGHFGRVAQVVLTPVLLLAGGRLLWRLVRWLKKGR